LGAVQVAHHNYEDAESLLLSDPEQFFAPAAQMSGAERRAAISHLVQLYQRWPKLEKAATWQRRLDEIPIRTK